MQRISRVHLTRILGPSSPLVGEVSSGERLLIEVNRGSGQPTGPLRVRDAEPGDTLAVRIDAVRPAADGEMWARPGFGAFGEELFGLLSGTAVRKVPVRDGRVIFAEGLIELPANPMVGVVGTIPLGTDLPTIWPGRHGGNLDCKLVTAGTTVFVPVFVEGAGLAIGDIHAAMGDGEVMLSGVEVEGEIEATVELFRGQRIDGPILETPDEIAVLASAKSLDVAASLALHRALHLLQHQLNLDFVEAGMLLSIASDLGICAVVNPLVTARVSLRRTSFPQLRALA